MQEGEEEGKKMEIKKEKCIERKRIDGWREPRKNIKKEGKIINEEIKKKDEIENN